jgi:hypothetical protein
MTTIHYLYPLLVLLGAWSLLLTFYTLYLAAINLYENRAETSKAVLVIASPMLVSMLVCDFLMQMTIATVIFLDPPRDLLVTGRLKRYRDTGSGWRKHWATEICERGLNPFAPTKKHC